MMITRLSKQGGRRYCQMGGILQIAFMMSVGTTGAAPVLGQLPAGGRYRWGYHDATVYR